MAERSVHEVAREAVARDLHDFDCGCGEWASHSAPIRAVYLRSAARIIAALVASAEVRAGLVAEGMPAVPRADVAPMMAGNDHLTAYYRRRAEAVVDTILAALAGTEVAR